MPARASGCRRRRAAAGAGHGRAVHAAAARARPAAPLACRRARARLLRIQPGDDQPQRLGRRTLGPIRSSARGSPRSREGLALVGVVWRASRRRSSARRRNPDAGTPAYAWCFAALTLIATAIVMGAPERARPASHAASAWSGARIPLADALFRRLLLVFVLNGIASAIPATLVLFYIADVLRAGIAAGALSSRCTSSPPPPACRCGCVLSARIGKVHAWALGMVATARRSSGRAGSTPAMPEPFAVVCALSGLALGADLALPPSLLADVIGRAGSDAARPARTSGCGRSRPS